MSQPWCLSIERSTTPNKVILLTTISNLTTARNWVDDTLPELYQTHLMDKIDVTTLRPIVPRRLDKPILTSASRMYASRLKQSTEKLTVIPTKQNPLNRPPKSKIVKPADITFAEATANARISQQPATHTMATTQPMVTTPIAAPFDTDAELQKIAKEVETTLQAKFDKVFAKLQQSLDTIEHKVEQKIQTHMNQLQQTQADKATQDNHSKQLDTLTKTLKILLRQVNTLLDQTANPTPMNGVGDS